MAVQPDNMFINFPKLITNFSRKEKRRAECAGVFILINCLMPLKG